MWAALAIYVVGTILLWFGLRRCAPGVNKSTPFVSVVVAARNEERRLPGLLADLAAQTYPAFEAIVVDDRSTDATANLVRAAAQKYPERFRLIQQMHVPNGKSPKKSALQKGVEAGRGEILLLTDADCRVKPGWVAGMVGLFGPHVSMVLGYSELMITRQSSLFERVQSFEFMTLVTTMAASANLNWPLGASGQNLAYRRTIFDQVGGYTSVLDRIAGDDMLMLQLIKRAPDGGCVVYADAPETRNRTYPEPSWQAFRNQRARWASSGTHHFQGDKVFMMYALSSLVVNMMVLFGGLWAWAGWVSWTAWIATIGLKLTVDVLLHATACRRFGRLGLVRYLPLWFVSQPLYILAMAVWGQRGSFSWKP